MKTGNLYRKAVVVAVPLVKIYDGLSLTSRDVMAKMYPNVPLLHWPSIPKVEVNAWHQQFRAQMTLAQAMPYEHIDMSASVCFDRMGKISWRGGETTV